MMHRVFANVVCSKPAEHILKYKMTAVSMKTMSHDVLHNFGHRKATIQVGIKYSMEGHINTVGNLK